MLSYLGKLRDLASLENVNPPPSSHKSEWPRSLISLLKTTSVLSKDLVVIVLYKVIGKLPTLHEQETHHLDGHGLPRRADGTEAAPRLPPIRFHHSILQRVETVQRFGPTCPFFGPCHRFLVKASTRMEVSHAAIRPGSQQRVRNVDVSGGL
jgi:hypothetical protein